MKVREAELKEFVEFPYILYKNCDKWVGELKSDVLSLIDISHPFWKNAERKLFVAEDNGKIKGRISAIINYSHNDFWKEKCCFFGFFDCENDSETASVLFSEVEKYALSRGMNILRGPANPSSNYTWGVLVENFDMPNRIMMPYNYPYYEKLIVENGFYKEKDLYAFEWKTSYFKGLNERLFDKIKRSNSDVIIENPDLNDFDSIFEDVKNVYNKAWENNWGFVPMSNDEIKHMALKLKSVLKSDYIIFARNLNGETVGFSLILPDFNQALSVLKGRFTPFNIIPFIYRYFFKIDGGRMLTLGINREYRGRGIEVLIIIKAIDMAIKNGWKWGELSWTLEDNIKINRTIEKFGGKLYRKYRIFRRDL